MRIASHKGGVESSQRQARFTLETCDMGDFVEVNLLLFAKSREIIGHKEVKLLLPSSCSGRQLLNHILIAYPGLNLIVNNIVLSLNEEYLELDSEVNLQDNDEIAVIPPISGG